MARTERIILLTIPFLIALLLAAKPGPADAWKPYTHNFTGDNAYNDAVDDGHVTINGREYAVNPRLVMALQQKPAWYNAGVVGPDAYPDLIMGQSVIHPENTGLWLRHVLNKAWDAQVDPRYTEDEKLQILAFGYGFLTHAAGDMWAHTIVNDFAEGVFPSVGEIAEDPATAAIALKHIIVEGYIGDATPGFDGNPERSPVPGEVNENGDQQYSDDATHGIAYAPPPDLFLWETFIGRAADANGHLTLPLPGQPTAARGPLLEFFFDLRNDLYDSAGTNANWQQALNAFNGLAAKIDRVWAECSGIPDPIECPLALGALLLESFTGFADWATNALEAALEEVIDAYLRAWVDDIDHGLQHWGNVGQAFAAGQFDPHTRRVLQDEECSDKEGGDLVTGPRANCEDAIGVIDTFLDTLGEGFTTADPHLLSMIGFPDAVGDLIEFADEIFDAIDEAIDLPNPLAAPLDELKQYLKDKVLESLSDVLGFDVEVFADVVRNPASYLDPVALPRQLPPPLDVFNQAGLFAEGEHERLDAILGLPADHHHPDRRLKDNVQFIVENFDPLENTIVTAKLLLLNGDTLNQVMSDILGRSVATYPGGDRVNFMFTALESGEPWLRSIDSDHAWRQDGLPRFCTEGGYCPEGAEPRPASLNGGWGTMPVWESCVLRPAFGVLFDNWETNPEWWPAADTSTEWPAYGDGVSRDSASDPSAPNISLVQSGAFHDNGQRKFVGGDNVFTLSASDTPAGKGFAESELSIRYRINGGSWVTAEQGDQFSLSGPDGKYVIEVQAADPCHPFDAPAGLDPAASTVVEYWLDTTAPVVTCKTPPFGMTFDTDDFATLDYDVADGADGSGVASIGSTIDGYLAPGGTKVVVDGEVLDMYQYYPDTRTVTVSAADNIGNSGSTGCAFEIEATPESLINNLKRARAEGLVPNADVYRGLMDKLEQVQRQHAKAKHSVEWNALDAFINQLEGQRGKGIDLVTADRFIAYAAEIIAAGR